jgi:hypothetical protein
MGLNETLFDAKIRYWGPECAYFSFNKWPIETHDGANAKFSTKRITVYEYYVLVRDFLISSGLLYLIRYLISAYTVFMYMYEYVLVPLYFIYLYVDNVFTLASPASSQVDH